MRFQSFDRFVESGDGRAHHVLHAEVAVNQPVIAGVLYVYARAVECSGVCFALDAQRNELRGLH